MMNHNNNNNFNNPFNTAGGVKRAADDLMDQLSPEMKRQLLQSLMNSATANNTPVFTPEQGGIVETPGTEEVVETPGEAEHVGEEGDEQIDPDLLRLVEGDHEEVGDSGGDAQSLAVSIPNEIVAPVGRLECTFRAGEKVEEWVKRRFLELRAEGSIKLEGFRAQRVVGEFKDWPGLADNVDMEYDFCVLYRQEIDKQRVRYMRDNGFASDYEIKVPHTRAHDDKQEFLDHSGTVRAGIAKLLIKSRFINENKEVFGLLEKQDYKNITVTLNMVLLDQRPFFQRDDHRGKCDRSFNRNGHITYQSLANMICQTLVKMEKKLVVSAFLVAQL
ncbi:unnamed protein product [Amoebophrya sp. A25]|nr:unnamed protein product [Amoebophrya sp. A25]|eukprot:GSA25T00027856001.1